MVMSGNEVAKSWRYATIDSCGNVVFFCQFVEQKGVFREEGDVHHVLSRFDHRLQYVEANTSGHCAHHQVERLQQFCQRFFVSEIAGLNSYLVAGRKLFEGAELPVRTGNIKFSAEVPGYCFANEARTEYQYLLHGMIKILR